jgi:DNA ligase (NAD+)
MLLEWLSDKNNVNMIQELHKAGVRPTEIKEKKAIQGSLTGTVFVVTGEFAQKREDIIRKLEALGGVSKSGVSTKVNLLISGRDAGSTKTNAAKKNNIKIVDEAWVLATLGEEDEE